MSHEVGVNPRVCTHVPTRVYKRVCQFIDQLIRPCFGNETYSYGSCTSFDGPCLVRRVVEPSSLSKDPVVTGDDGCAPYRRRLSSEVLIVPPKS